MSVFIHSDSLYTHALLDTFYVAMFIKIFFSNLYFPFRK